MTKPTLQARLLSALTYYNCRPSHLAKASGVSQAVVHRISKGQHENVMASTMEALQPYLNLELPQNAVEDVSRPRKAHKPRKPGAFPLP